MRKNKLKAKIALGEPAYGVFASIPHPTSIEMIGHAEFDFVIIDFEHASTNMETVEEMIRAAELMDITPLVRVSAVDRIEILKVLDCGAQGIVVPNVTLKEQIDEVVRHAFYYPIGMRSLNSGRAGSFAKYSLAEYIARANEEVLVVPMIESAEGVNESIAILSSPYVGFVLGGAADLSQSLGVPWQTEHPDVQSQLDRLFEASRLCDVPYAVVSRSLEEHREWARKGASIFVLGDDRNTAFRALWEKRKAYALGERQ